MEAHLLGFRLWVQAVEAAGTARTDAVRKTIIGMQARNLGGTMVTVRDNNHIDKPAMVAQIEAGGKLRPIWTSPAAIAPQPWSDYIASGDRGTR
jgi:urea transport system substrate-binding protein